MEKYLRYLHADAAGLEPKSLSQCADQVFEVFGERQALQTG